MSHVQINSTTITTEVEVVLDALYTRTAEAQLLGQSGEELQCFGLKKGRNLLSLKNYPSGIYGLRICTDNEVTVRKIEITR